MQTWRCEKHNIDIPNLSRCDLCDTERKLRIDISRKFADGVTLQELCELFHIRDEHEVLELIRKFLRRISKINWELL